LRWPERSGLILRRSGGYSLPRAPTPRRARLARLRPRLGCGWLSCRSAGTARA